jgi:hypothetical protein
LLPPKSSTITIATMMITPSTPKISLRMPIDVALLSSTGVYRPARNSSGARKRRAEFCRDATSLLR